MYIRVVRPGNISTFILVMSLALVGCASRPTISASCGQNNDFQKKLAACGADVQKNPSNDLAREHLAESLVHFDRYQDALQNINIAIDENPKEGWYYANRCIINYALAQYADGLEDCTTAIGLINDAQGFVVYRFRATNEYRLAKYADAKSDLDKAISLNPNDVPSYGWRCAVEFVLSDYTDDVKSCEYYLSHASNQTDDDYKIYSATTGAAYYSLKEFDKAKPYADLALQDDPVKATLFSGEHELDLFNLDFRREKIKSYVAQAELQASLGNTQKAFDAYYAAYPYIMSYTPSDLQQAHALMSDLFTLYPKLTVKPSIPDLARGYQVEAETYIKNHDNLNAIKAMRTAYYIAPWYPVFSYNLALLYADNKDLNSAIGFMKVYVQLSPNSPDTQAAKDKIYEWTADMGLPN